VLTAPGQLSLETRRSNFKAAALRHA